MCILLKNINKIKWQKIPWVKLILPADKYTPVYLVGLTLSQHGGKYCSFL